LKKGLDNFASMRYPIKALERVRWKSAVVAELAYAHDSGSCPYYLGAGSSPANCRQTKNELWAKIASWMGSYFCAFALTGNLYV
jgi:hypothetical protein